MSEAKYTRPLSAVERVWLVADRMTSPFVNQLVLEGEGELVVERWREAVERAAEANPGVRVVLKGCLKGSRWVAAGPTPPVVEVDGSEWDGRCERGAPFLRRALLPKTGPTAEILLVQGAVPRVVVRTHHAMSDGRGTLCFVEDIFRVLRGKGPIGCDSTLDDVTLAKELGAEEGEVRKEDCLAPTGEARPEEAGVRWRRVTLSGRPSRLLPKVAVMLAREAREYGEGRVRFDVPVDMRAQRPELRSTANLTGMLHLDVPEDATDESLLADLREQLDAKAETRIDRGLEVLRSLPLWFMSWAGGVAVKRVQKRGRYISSGVLSNLGRLPLAEFEGGGFATRLGFFIPPGAESQPFFLALCGHDEGVELVATSPKTLATDERLEKLLESLADEAV